MTATYSVIPSGPTLPILSLHIQNVNTALPVHTSTNLVAWTVCRKLLETAVTSTEGRAGICAWKLRNACIVRWLWVVWGMDS